VTRDNTSLACRPLPVFMLPWLPEGGMRFRQLWLIWRHVSSSSRPLAPPPHLPGPHPGEVRHSRRPGNGHRKRVGTSERQRKEQRD